jgi:hypothetical protein
MTVRFYSNRCAPIVLLKGLCSSNWAACPLQHKSTINLFVPGRLILTSFFQKSNKNPVLTAYIHGKTWSRGLSPSRIALAFSAAT